MATTHKNKHLKGRSYATRRPRLPATYLSCACQRPCHSQHTCWPYTRLKRMYQHVWLQQPRWQILNLGWENQSQVSKAGILFPLPVGVGGSVVLEYVMVTTSQEGRGSQSCWWLLMMLMLSAGSKSVQGISRLVLVYLNKKCSPHFSQVSCNENFIFFIKSFMT